MKDLSNTPISELSRSEMEEYIKCSQNLLGYLESYQLRDIVINYRIAQRKSEKQNQ